jgi:flagellar assembly protein FliH
MNSSSSAAAWSPSLDLTTSGLSKFDPKRVAEAIVSGRDAGYRAGFESGRGEATRQVENERHRAQTEAAQLINALAMATHQVASADSIATAAFANHVIDVALDLAAAIVQRELSDDHHAATEALRRVLLELDVDAAVMVRMHPDDVAHLGETSLPVGVRITGDTTVSHGDAVATTSSQNVDARIGAAIERVRIALGGLA